MYKGVLCIPLCLPATLRGCLMVICVTTKINRVVLVPLQLLIKRSSIAHFDSHTHTYSQTFTFTSHCHPPTNYLLPVIY